MILTLAFVLRPSPEDQMLSAAESVISSLSDVQKKQAVYQFKDTLRDVWHYLPATDFTRNGIALTELDDEQDAKVYELLKSVLSQEGYDKVQTIMDLENVLRELENNPTRRDPQKYHISFFGIPAKKGTWGWGFSGHHVSLHFTMVNGHLATTPTFLGSNPAEVRSGEHKGLRVLKDEEDMGLDLINSLSTDQQKTAIILKESPYEVYTGSMREVSPLDQLGVSYAEMDSKHQKQLKSLVGEYLSTLPKELAHLRSKKIDKNGWDDIHFAWAGVTDRSAGHYYRIQGESFLIEFDNTQNDANHVHTVWRDFAGDFGRDLLKEHYDNSH